MIKYISVGNNPILYISILCTIDNTV